MATTETPDGVRICPSPHSVKDSIDRLQDLLQKNGVTIYVRIDQQKEMQRTGQSAGPLEYLLFGNPKVGGPVMMENPIAALDLPLKVIAWEDAQHQVWLAYNEASYIRQRFFLSAQVAAPLDLHGLIEKVSGPEKP